MTPQFSIVSKGPLNLYSGIPPDYPGPILPAANFFSSVNDIGQVLVQELRSDHYILRYNIFRFIEKISLHSKVVKQGLHTRFMLKNNVQHYVKDAQRIDLREGQYTMIWSSQAESLSRFEKNTEYKTLDIFYSPSILQQLASYFPELETVISMEPGHPLLLADTRRIAPAMKDIIREIMECSFDPAISQFYFDCKVREFLYLLLNDTYNNDLSASLRLSSFDTEAIQEARRILLQDISKKPMTIPELSKKVSVNEFKLKKGFRELFGTSIFECLTEARMEKARELLLSTDLPIKAICIHAGYARITNFITAFRRRYGYTPGSLRRSLPG